MKVPFTIFAALKVGSALAQSSFTVPSACQPLVTCLDEIVGHPIDQTLFVFDGSESISDEDICDDILGLFGDDLNIALVCGAAEVITPQNMIGIRKRNLFEREKMTESRFRNLRQRILNEPTTFPSSSFTEPPPSGAPLGAPTSFCPAKFDPGYPFKGDPRDDGILTLFDRFDSYSSIVSESKNLGYETVVRPYRVGGAGIFPAIPKDDERSNEDIAGIILLAKGALQLVDALAGICDNDILQFLTLGGCTAVQIGIDSALVGLEFAVESIAFHDTLIDNAEIQAGYKNTETIIDQVCRVEEAAIGIDGGVQNILVDTAILKRDTSEINQNVDQVLVDTDILKRDTRNILVDTDILKRDTTEILADTEILKRDTSIIREFTDGTILQLYIERVPNKKRKVYLVQSSEDGRGEKAIDLSIDCFDERELMYKTQPFTQKVVSEGSLYIELPRKKGSSSSSSDSGDSKKGGSECKSGIYRLTGVVKEGAPFSGIKSSKTLIMKL